jgi:hypothetical protein
MFDDANDDFSGGAADLFESMGKVEQQRADNKAKNDIWKIYKPTEVAEVVQLFAGSYGPDKSKIYQYYRAYAPTYGKGGGGHKYVNCCCGNGKLSTPCTLHYMLKEDLNNHKNENKYKSPYYPAPVWAFNVFQLSYFHKVMVEKGTNRDGSVKPYAKWVLCTDRREQVNVEDTRCPECLRGNVERKFGNRAHLSCGSGFFGNIMSIAHDIGKFCKHCGSEMYTVKYICPECWKQGRETVLLDPRNPGHLTSAQLETFWVDRCVCQACNSQVRPREVLKCTGCTEKPVMGRSIFENPIKIKKQGSDAQTTIVHVGEIITPKPYPESLKKQMIPFDFDKFFITDAEQQSIDLGVPNPFKGSNIRDREIVQEPTMDSVKY